MECKICGQPLMVAHSEFKSEVGSTDVFQEMTLVCTNPKCGNYAGTDLNNPRGTAETIRNKVN
jgi:hypothetical protein